MTAFGQSGQKAVLDTIAFQPGELLAALHSNFRRSFLSMRQPTGAGA